MDEQVDYVIAIRAISWTFGAIIISMSAARLWVRFNILNQPNWDDLFNVLATTSAIACTALVTVGTYYGLGRSKHTIDSPSDLTEAIKYTVVAPTFFLLSTSFGKLTALIFLVRLMGLAAPRWQIVTVWAVCGVMVALNIIGFFITIGFCYPAAKQWNPSLEGWCMSTQLQVIAGYTISTYHALIDIIIATYPALLIRRLRISCITRFGLCLLMGGGWFAAAATFMKMSYYQNLLSDDADLTLSWAPLTLWYIAEMDAIIIFGTIPTLWPLLKVFSGNCITRSKNLALYEQIQNGPDDEYEAEAFQLGDLRPNRRAGPVTRLLEEVDGMRTSFSVAGGN